ncbi:MAG: DUF805 domain-containing protein [bacterium]
MNWFLKVIKNYAGFNGRAQRKEYWFFTLFSTIFTIVLMILDNVLGINTKGTPYGPLYVAYSIAVIIPSLAVVVRRLHDVGKSGGYIFITLVPFFGAFWLLYLLISDSNPNENKYGPNPKGIDSDGQITNNTYSDPTAYSCSSSDIIILIAVIWMFIAHAFWIVSTRYVNSALYTEWFRYANLAKNIIWGILPLFLAFAVNNKTKKIALFIIGGIYLIYELYDIAVQFLAM